MDHHADRVYRPDPDISSAEIFESCRNRKFLHGTDVACNTIYIVSVLPG